MARKTLGWEEAGSEFYQECYNSEWESFSKNSAIATLLPSKQNRFGTYRKTYGETQELKKSKYWQTQTSNSQILHQHHDVNFSVLPDLSQVLNDEENIWEEMVQIKLMPVTMQQKRELKSELQNATKLRLQGFNQLKWKHRKIWQNIRLNWSKLSAKLDLWQSSLKQIEGHFGTGVVAYFIFLRWLFYLNCITFMAILLFVIVPNLFVYKSDPQCHSNNVNYSLSCFSQPAQAIITGLNVLDVVQGTGALETSLMFYGAYSNKIIGAEQNSTCIGEHKSHFLYDLPLAYVFVAVGYFSVALIAIVKAAAYEFKDRLVNGNWQFYRYCNLLFGGWDFCIHNKKSANIKHKAVLNEIYYLLQSKRIQFERNRRSRDYMCKLIATRIVINFVILTILIFSAYLIYVLFNLSLSQPYQLDSYAFLPNNFSLENTTIDEVRKSNSSMDNMKQSQKLIIFFINFIPYIAIVGLNLVLPTIFNFLSNFEKYSPLFVMKMSLFRTIFLRLASLAVLLSRFYHIVVPKSESHIYKSNICWETFVGQQFYKLAITDFVSQLFVTFFINFPRSLVARKINHNFFRFVGQQEFELPKHVLDIVYSQTICWLGSFYTPILPALTAIFTFCMFYTKKFQCLVNSKPSKFLYMTSNANSLFMFVLLISFFIAVTPLTYALAEISPSLSCGPFKGLNTVWDAPISAFMKMPSIFKNFIFFFGTAGFAIPCFVLLLLLIYYFYAVSDANKNMVDVLKNQLVLEGHDKQFLITRLSAFLKQHQYNP